MIDYFFLHLFVCQFIISNEIGQCDEDEQCIKNEFCQKMNRVGYCYCKPGHEISKATSLCELSKILFTRFRIYGPDSVTLPYSKVEFRVDFLDYSDENQNWNYFWEILEGTGLAFSLQTKNNEYSLTRVCLLKGAVLDNLQPGILRLMLTINNSTTEGVAVKDLQVLPKPQYLNIPNAIIKPQGPIFVDENREIFLDASDSLDFSGNITHYKWLLTNEQSVTLANYSMKSVKLQNLLAGNYTITLEVTNNSGQKDEIAANIIVSKPNQNFFEKLEIAPCDGTVKDAKNNQITVTLPIEKLFLCAGLDRTKDENIISFKWTRIDNLKDIVLNFAGISNPVLVVKDLQTNKNIGPYEFLLKTINVNHFTQYSTVKVFVEPEPFIATIVRVENCTVILPNNLAILKGSTSANNERIVAYEWQPLEYTPASLTVLGNSNKDADLMLTNLVEGKFLFNLTVWDVAKKSHSTIAELIVKAGSEHQNSVQLLIRQNRRKFSTRWARKLADRLAAAFAAQMVEADSVKIYFTRFFDEQSSGFTTAIFYALYVPSKDHNFMEQNAPTFIDSNLNFPQSSSTNKIVRGPKVVDMLRQQVVIIKEFEIAEINTLFCFLDCSSHGICNNMTKQCDCNLYWMPNLFNRLKTGRIEDCSWSILYSALLIFIVITPICTKITIFLWSGHFNKRKNKKGNYDFESVFQSKFLSGTRSPTKVRRKPFERPSSNRKYHTIATSSDIETDDGLFINRPTTSQQYATTRNNFHYYND